MPAFINTAFHCAQELVLPSFCTNLVHPKEKAWHMLDVRRALCFYTERTRDTRKTDSLFVKFGGSEAKERARWLRLAIADAYKALRKEPPQGITAHSTRGQQLPQPLKVWPLLFVGWQFGPLQTSIIKWICTCLRKLLWTEESCSLW